MDLPDGTPRREWVIGYVSALTGVTLVFCLIRAASRLQRGTLNFGFDDLFIALSWLTSAAMTALTIVGNVEYHFQRPTANVEAELLPKAYEYIWILNILYLAQTGFAKISILLFYQRLVESTCSRRFRFAIWALIGVVLLYSIVISVIYITECLPITAAWLRYDSNWTSSNAVNCASSTQNVVVAWIAGLFAVITTFLTTLLPSSLFVQIRLSKRARIALAIILALGFLVVVPSLFRLVYLVRAAQPGADRLWQSYKALISGKTEGDVGIICACAPSLNIFFRRYFRDPYRVSNAMGSGSKTTAPTSRENTSRRYGPGSTVSGHTSAPSSRSILLKSWPLAGERGLGLNINGRPAAGNGMSDIPEAYAGTSTTDGTSIHDWANHVGMTKVPKAVTKKAPSKRSSTIRSWLNLDDDPSDDEEDEKMRSWLADKSP